MKIIVETISADKTRTWFQDSDGCEHWAIELTTEPNGHAWYCVTFDGWVVWELKCRELRINERGVFATDCFATGKPRQEIPAYVLSHLPKVTR